MILGSLVPHIGVTEWSIVFHLCSNIALPVVLKYIVNGGPPRHFLKFTRFRWWKTPSVRLRNLITAGLCWLPETLRGCKNLPGGNAGYNVFWRPLILFNLILVCYSMNFTPSTGIVIKSRAIFNEVIIAPRFITIVCV